MLGALTNRKTRSRIIQSAVLVAVTGVIVAMAVTAHRNMVDQGIATGFDFLERSTGWPINFALVDVTARSPYWKMLVAGLLNTLLVGSLGLVFASLVGLLVGLARIAENGILNLIGTVYVEIFRNVPMILQVFFWYAVLTHLPVQRQAISLGGVVYLSNRGLVLPGLDIALGAGLLFLVACLLVIVGASIIQHRLKEPARWLWPAAIALIGISVALLVTFGRGGGDALVTVPHLRGLRFVGGFSIKPEFTALLIAMALFGGAYIGEIVRGGFLSVDQGRIEAARALGLKPGQINRFVRIPLAVRAMLPALTNQYIWLMKSTTLGIAIGFPDYFMVISTSINQSGQTIELLGLLMLGFLAINYSLGSGLNALNRHLAIKGRSQ